MIVVQGAGDHREAYLGGAMQAQYPGGLTQGGAGGHHVVYEQDAQAREVAAALEGAPDIGLARPVGLAGLGRGGAGPLQAVTVNRSPEAFSQAPGDQGCLVETAFPQALRMQGQRHDPVDAVGIDRGGELLAEPAGEG